MEHAVWVWCNLILIDQKAAKCNPAQYVSCRACDSHEVAPDTVSAVQFLNLCPAAPYTYGAINTEYDFLSILYKYLPLQGSKSTLHGSVCNFKK